MDIGYCFLKGSGTEAGTFSGRHKLGKRNHEIKIVGLSRLLTYVLGHKPDEFGLVPDMEGFITLKELLKAIHEEEGWSYVRLSHINEVLLGQDRSLFQCEGNRIRTKKQQWTLPINRTETSLPKILFTPIRAKAHAFVMDKGLRADRERSLVLSPDRALALRIGKRRDQNPVIIEVIAAEAQQRGTPFYQFGGLFLSSGISPQFIAGPLVPKKTLERAKKQSPTPMDPLQKRALDFTPGSFSLDPLKDPDLTRRKKGKRPKGWKEKARKYRKKT